MDEYYSVNQTAFLLKIHPLTVRRYLRDGKLKALRAGGAVRVAKSDIDKFLQTFVPYSRTAAPVGKQTIKIKPFDQFDAIFRMRARGSSN